MTSYVHGVSTFPLSYKTIGAALAETASRWPDRDALIVPHQDISLTWSKLLQMSDAFAASLLELGLQPGDRVGLWSVNRYEWVVTQLATARAGLILVNVNPAYRKGELAYALNKVGCRALVLAPDFKSSNFIEIVQSLIPELSEIPATTVASPSLPDLRTIIRFGSDVTPGMHNFDTLVENGHKIGAGNIQALQGQFQPDDPINIQFTSGTTGLPKGATLTHHNILNNGYLFGVQMAFSEKDRLCVPLPLYHCFGMVLGVLNCLMHGAAIVLPGEAFEAQQVLQVIQDQKCTALYGVPTMFIAELGCPDFDRYDLSSLRTGCMAGSPCPVEVMKKVISDMGVSEISIAYGMTETSPASFQTLITDSLERRTETVGVAHPHVEAKVIDENGHCVTRGMSGELLTRGYHVMLGYWDDEAKTKEAIDSSGWMHTGDLATIDKQGYCRIVGRLKDMLIRGGENVYPREIEEYIFQHDAVEDVQVIGVPDQKYGEEICAWIKLKPGAICDAEAIKTFCKERISHYKVPRHIRFVDEFPMTVTGKVQKFAMRDIMIKEFERVGAQTT